MGTGALTAKTKFDSAVSSRVALKSKYLRYSNITK